MGAPEPDRLIVDGYNVVHAWSSLKGILQRQGLESARRALVDALGAYRAVRGAEISVVFDSHGRGRIGADPPTVHDGVRVMFGHSTASADNVIERLVNEAAHAHRLDHLIVVTSDRLQRELVHAMGAGTMSSTMFEAEVVRAMHDTGERRRTLEDRASFERRLEYRVTEETRRRLERLRRGESDPGGTARPERR